MSDHAEKKPKFMSPLTMILCAVGILGASICVWFLVFALGATLNSEQFRNLLNIASVQTVYDAPVPLPAEAPKDQPVAGAPASGVIKPTSAGPSQADTGLRSWQGLSNLDRRLPAKEPGKPDSYNPERTEYVLSHFLGYSPGVWLILLLAMTTYTPTNLAILSCLAGLAGAAALRVGCTLPTDDYGIPIGARNLQAVRFWTTMMRGLGTGFIVYLTGMAGTMIVSGQPFQVQGPDDYNRLVATISLASFVLAVRPRLFFTVLENLNLGPRTGQQNGEEGGSERPGQEVEGKPGPANPVMGSASAYIDGVPIAVHWC